RPRAAVPLPVHDARRASRDRSVVAPRAHRGLPTAGDAAEARAVLAAARNGCDVGLVPGRVGERPPRLRELIAHHATARGERRLDARLGLLSRHPDADVDRAEAVLARLLHRLEPEPGPAAARIHEVLVGRIGTALVTEHRL